MLQIGSEMEKIEKCSIIVLLALPMFFSCNPAEEDNGGDGSEGVLFSGDSLEFTVEEALEWDGLFTRSSGWFGGDGIFSIPLNGMEHEKAGEGSTILFLFSDSMIGEVSDSTLSGTTMVNNAVAYLKGSDPMEDSISFHWDHDNGGNPKTLFIPSTPAAEDGDYYWLGDAFVNQELDQATYIFAYRMRNMDTDEAWSFTQMAIDLIKLPRGSEPPFEDRQVIETPLHLDEGGFGAGVFVNTATSGAPNPDGHIYIYGVKGMEKHLLVARVLAEEFEDFLAWRFWDGKGWSEDILQSASIAEGVSNELSVSVLANGKYALVFQLNGMSSTVGLRLGESPFGPFGEVIDVWNCSEGQQENYITYNAKAHPSLSPPGQLLISYNVNAFNFFNELNANPWLYRPRFIRLTFD